MEENTNQTDRPGTAEEFEALVTGRFRGAFAEKLRQILDRQTRAQGRYLAYQKLLLQAEQARREYPDFELKRELEDPTFLKLLRGGADPKTAYEAAHHRQLVEAAREKTAQTLRRKAERPVENGLGGDSVATVYRPDPRHMSREERKLLRRRAGRGERVSF